METLEGLDNFGDLGEGRCFQKIHGFCARIDTFPGFPVNSR